MAGSPRVLELLEEMLDTGKTPDDVCSDCPDLLPEVRRRWREFCAIDEEVGLLLPGVWRGPAVGAPTPAPPTPGLPQVPGYEVEAVLGRGGMGVVYRARQRALGRPVAVKMLLAGPFASQQELGRFHREAAVLACLRHPNIVQVHDAGDVDGRPYFAMELVEGGSLAQQLSGAPQPARPAAVLVSTLARAVEVAHQAGIVHRDLKPANVLLTVDGTPKVSDFGLARRLGGEDGLTRTGAALGTPSYMAPEQAQGNTDAVGPAADVYALGAILYELLTGHPPFRAATDLETVQQVTSREPVPPSRLNSTVPRDLETICLKCLHKEPRRRYATAAALAEDLDHFLRGEAVTARPVGPVERLARRVQRRPALSAAVAASVLLLGVVVGGGLWVLSERLAERRAAERDVEEMARWLRQSSWREARAALELAKDRLGDRGSAELRGRMDQGQRDLELAQQLEVLSASADGVLGTRTYDAEYESLFRAAGLGQVSESPEVVAARVRASDIRDALVRSLDEWASYASDLQRRRWVEEVARLADPDPSGWRVLVSAPDVLRDEAALQKVLETAPQPFPSLPLLRAIQLRLEAEHKDPLPFLMRVQQAHPGDFWVNYRLGGALFGTNPAEAVRYFQAAVSLRPSAVYANLNLGNALATLGRLDDALARFRRVEELAPTNYSNRLTIAKVLSQLGRLDEAEAQIRRTVALDPSFVDPKVLWVFLAQHGREDAALREWKGAIDAHPTDHNICHGYAEMCVFLGREEEYRAARQSLLFRFGPTTDLVVAARSSWACLLLPAEGDELCQAVALAERAAAADQRRFKDLLAYFRFAQALAEYRLGRFERAISLLRAEPSVDLGPAPRLVLAMALHRNGERTEARTVLEKVVLSRDWRASQAGDPEGWLYYVLRREAEALILPDLPAVLAGERQPRDNDERLTLLGVCQDTDRTRALARLYADAFAADPRLADDLAAGHRYSAARAAARAGCGRGTDAAGLGEEQRRRWRDQARRWLREDLVAWQKTLSGPTASRLRAAQTLTRWRGDSDLAGLRTPPELAKLPADERRDCLALWAEVDDLLNCARKTAPTH
jgi:serine/threonine-protein kinase